MPSLKQYQCQSFLWK